MGQCLSAPADRVVKEARASPHADKAEACVDAKGFVVTQQEVVLKPQQQPQPQSGGKEEEQQQQQQQDAATACKETVTELAGPKMPEPIVGKDVPTDMILNMLDHDNGPAAGLPYKVHSFGPPPPPCETDRLQTVKAMSLMDCDPDPEIASILKLTASIFRSPAALVALFDHQRVFISDSEGAMPRGDFPWRWTLCAWSMAFKNPQILVIPDTLQDARFAENEKVTRSPNVRFYCGAPLVASNGHRLGTICFLDVKPRKFDAASCTIVNNMAEMVVRRLEKIAALKTYKDDTASLAEAYSSLHRTLDQLERCVVMLDVAQEGWEVLHTNSAWTKITGIERDDVMGMPLGKLLEGLDGTLPTPEMEKAARAGEEFRITGAHVRGAPSLRTYTLTFRSGSRGGLDEGTAAIGIPAFLPAKPSAGDATAINTSAFYFMTVEVESIAGGSVAGSACASTAMLSSFMLGGWSSNSSGGHSMATAPVIDGLKMGHLLGSGSFGKVYAGTWFGTSVAVKVIDQQHASAAIDGAALEALLSSHLHHPHIVATLCYAVKKLNPSGGDTTRSLNSGSHAGTTTSGFSGSSGTRPSSMSTDLEMRTAAIEARKEAVEDARVKIPEPVLEERSEELERAGVEEDTAPAPAGPEEVHLDCTNAEASQGGGARLWAVINFSDIGPGDGTPTGQWSQSAACNTQMTQHSSACGPVMSSGNCTGPGTGTQVGRPSMEAPVFGTWSKPADAEPMQQTWIVMEYCDRGSLQDGMDRGWLRTVRSALEGSANMPAVLATAREVASAMRFLHNHDVVHGDLSGWNVMLTAAGAGADEGGRNFVAKVADFGLSKHLDMASKLMTRQYGTLTHMPPETLAEGIIHKPTDVYSFGVLLWQMYTGSRPWSGLTHGMMIQIVATRARTLQWPEDCPAGYRELASACLDYDHTKRPTFDEVVAALGRLSADAQVHQAGLEATADA